MPLIEPFAPNRDVVQLAPGDTAWHRMLQNQGSFTRIPPGARPQSVTLRSISNASPPGDGSPFWIQINVGSSAPADTSKARLVSGSGQSPIEIGGFADLWVKATVATDTIIAEATF